MKGENSVATNSQLSLRWDFCVSALTSVLRSTTSYLQHLPAAAAAGRCRSEQGWSLHSWKRRRRMSPGCLTSKSVCSAQWRGRGPAYQPNSGTWAPLPHCARGTCASTGLSTSRRKKSTRQAPQEIGVGGYSSKWHFPIFIPPPSFRTLFNNPQESWKTWLSMFTAITIMEHNLHNKLL